MARKRTKLTYLSDRDVRSLGGVRMEIEGLGELLSALAEARTTVARVLTQAARAGASIIRQEAMRRAPGPGVDMDMVRRGKVEVHVDIGPDREHWYYQFFETGAAPHPIPRPSRKTVLVFEGRYGLVVTRHVQHPGMRPRPFLRPAVDEKADSAVQETGKVFRKALLDVVRRHGET